MPLPDQLPPARRMPSARFHAARRQLEGVVNNTPRSWRWRFGRRAAAGVGVGVLVVGGAAAAAAYFPSKGLIPSKNGVLEISKAPDFISVIVADKVIGYAPKADLILSPGSSQLPSGFGSTPIPGYKADLQTLIGHMYPGIGFVALGESPHSVGCIPESTIEGSTTQSVPCESVSVTLPNVVGMSTPTAAGQLSGLGVLVDVVNTQSATVPGGTIASMAPSPGKVVFARSTVTIYNSTGP
jgi:hypothetical protein